MTVAELIEHPRTQPQDIRGRTKRGWIRGLTQNASNRCGLFRPLTAARKASRRTPD